MTSLRSTIYSRIGDPPSASGGCHASVKEVSDIPDTSNGPRGGDGLSGNIQYIIYLFSYGTVLLMHVSRNTVCLLSGVSKNLSINSLFLRVTESTVSSRIS